MVPTVTRHSPGLTGRDSVGSDVSESDGSAGVVSSSPVLRSDGVVGAAVPFRSDGRTDTLVEGDTLAGGRGDRATDGGFDGVTFVGAVV